MKELLLLLSRYPFEEMNRERLKKLTGDVDDWDHVTSLIRQHGITALAAYNISEAGLDKNIPEKTFTFLQNGLRRSIARNAWMKERWKEVNKILTEAGIKHVLLKGMALENTIYGSRGLRQMSDNDILISPEDALKAWKILKSKGFHSGILKSKLHTEILPQINKHLPTLTRDGYCVEIHSRLYDDPHEETDYAGLIRNSVQISIDGITAYVLPENSQLKYLISHFNKHLSAGECQLRHFADIKLLDHNCNIIFPEEFLLKPVQNMKSGFRKSAYRMSVMSVPLKIRLRYLAGDLFPSMRWMKARYKCGSFKAALHYPQRLGKLMWLIGSK
jgi:hypothetical protein